MSSLTYDLLYDPSDASTRATQSKPPLFYGQYVILRVLFIVLILFPYVTIPVLFILNANTRKTTNNYNEATTTISLPTVLNTDIRNGYLRNSRVTPLPVSLSSNGEIQLGADDITSQLSVVTISDTKKLVVLSNYTFDYDIYEDTSSELETAYVVAGRVYDGSYEITLGNGVLYVGLYSLSPLITRLSDDSFAIIYYDFNQTIPQVTTRYGYVNSDTLEDNILTETSPVYTLTSTRISNTTAVLVYTDALYDNAIRAVVVNINPVVNAITYSAALSVTDGQALISLTSGIIMDIDTTTLNSDFILGSDGNSNSGSATIAVLYSDINNGGAMELSLVQLTSTGSLVQQSPEFVLSSGNPSFESLYRWGAISAASTKTSTNQLIIASVLTQTVCNDYTTSIEISLYENKPAVLGLSTITSSTISPTTSTATAVLTGTVSGFTGLSPGYAYYSTTKGTIVRGNQYFGHVSSGFSEYYVDSTADSVIVSLDSYIGIAISDSTILLK
eukprot:gene18760-24527_t